MIMDGTVQAMVNIVHTVADLRAQVANWRADGLRVGLVPTMGALHAGHMELVRLARRKADRVVVSIFVNPTQFAPGEDLTRYPRQPEQDCARVADAGGHVVFMPSVDDMYRPGASTFVEVLGVSSGLCGDRRPGHFRGVATVVTKLLLQCLPDVAVFGEKDFQQLQVIRRMVTDLDIPVTIEAAPLVRDVDGLALSSRNAYLGPAERQTAPRLYAVLCETARSIREGADPVQACEVAAGQLEQAGFGPIDYLDVRDERTLQPPDGDSGSFLRLFAAVFLGKTRLIDTVRVWDI
ncbi:pantoate--beta-alanine ligase [Haematospirillum jordaniae]|nr:pantoate--beta-alanine ligase [Haematospirillum jordaniae]NKD85389.1 pantoate--beta-alanine ligase [Haematospirillum jordaniae]